MSLTKTTIQAFAASFVLVTAGAVVAGASVFHAPILGFGRAEAATAHEISASTPARAARVRAVKPRKIVRTRYVDDIVHRPSPTGAENTHFSGPSASTMPAPAFAASYAPAGATTATTATIAAAPATGTSSTTTVWAGDDDRHEHDRGGDVGDDAPDTPTSVNPAPGVDG